MLLLFHYKKSYLIVLFALFINIHLFAQTDYFALSGRVQNTEKEALPGATVFVHELNKGTTTDLDGNYRIEKIKKGTYHLHITYVGYESLGKTIVINSDRTENFELKPTQFELKELFIEAYPFKSGSLEQSLTIVSIDKSFLEKNTGTTFINQLEKLPGISSINTGVGIAKPVIRGMSFNRVMVNDHGIKQEGQQWGADHGLEIDQFGVERVEILKGPGSLMYGPDGIGGVINIKAPQMPQTNTLNATLTSRYQTNNEQVGISSMVEGNREGKVFRARYTKQDFADYKVPAENFTYATSLQIHDKRLKNTAGQENNFSFMGGVKKDWGYSTVTLSNYNQKAGMFSGTVGRPQAYQLTTDGDRRNIDLPHMNTNHFKVISNTNYLFKENWLEVDLGYQNNVRKEISFPHAHGSQPTPEGNTALKLNLHTLTANVRFHKSFTENFTGIHGVQYQHQQNFIGGFDFFIPEFNSFNTGIFNYFELKANKELFLSGGIRMDYGEHHLKEYKQPIYNNKQEVEALFLRSPGFKRMFFNTTGALGASWTPTSKLNFKLNAGSSFRMPAPVELSAMGVHHGNFRFVKGNPHLNNERGYQFDLNSTYFNNFIHLSFTPYFNYFDNYIYLSPSNRFASSLKLPFVREGQIQLWEYKEAKGIFTGFEFQGDLHFTKNFHLNAATEYVYAYNIHTNLSFPLTPPFSALIELEYTVTFKGRKINNLYFNAGGHQFAAQNRTDTNESETEGYFLLHADAGVEMILFKQPVNFFFSARNLLNEIYFNHLSRYRLLNLPEQGRNYSFTLKIPVSTKISAKKNN